MYIGREIVPMDTKVYLLVEVQHHVSHFLLQNQLIWEIIGIQLEMELLFVQKKFTKQLKESNYNETNWK